MAKFRWIYTAQDIAQVDTVTFALAWATGDDVTITCNKKAKTMIGGSSMDTTAEYAAGFAEMINSNSHDPDDLTADMTINSGGYESGEFRDMVATVSGSVVTITSFKPGVDFTVTVASTTAGTGTATHAAEVTAATGKNNFDNVDNWDNAGVMPPAGSVLAFHDGNVPVLRGLANTIENYSLDCKNGFTADFGLPPTNNTHSGHPYPEYRPQKLSLPCTAATGQQDHEIGSIDRSMAPSGIKRIDLGTNDGTNILFTVQDAAPFSRTSGAAVQLAGGFIDILTVNRGSLEAGTNPSESVTNIDNCNVGWLTDRENDAYVILGERTGGITTPATIQTGGILFFGMDNSSSIICRGGVINFDNDDATYGGLKVYGTGKAYRFGGSISTVQLYDEATFDNSRASSEWVNTLVEVRAGTTLIAPTGSVSNYNNGIDYVDCDPREVKGKLPANWTWTPSAI